MSTTPPELLHWQEELGKNMPVLSKPVLTVLAMMSFAMMQTQHCGRTRLAYWLASALGQDYKTLEQRLYQWCCLGKRTTGQEVADPVWDVQDCFAPLLAWIVRLWKSRYIALALDETRLYDRFTVLTISVVFRQTGIPIAWRVALAREKRPSWREDWGALIARLDGVIPCDWTVIVLTDRGLYAKWMFDYLLQAKWHPYMRVNGQGCFKPDAAKSQKHRAIRYLRHFVPKHGTYRAITGVAFSKDNQVACTALFCWDPAYTDPWIIITDLAPEACEVAWYGLRSWCEQGFKCFKRGAWQWQHTRMEDPKRAERLWLAISVATLWSIAVGAQFEDALLAETHFAQASIVLIPQPNCPRVLRLLRVGLNQISTCILRNRRIPLPFQLVPDPWPVWRLTRKS